MSLQIPAIRPVEEFLGLFSRPATELAPTKEVRMSIRVGNTLCFCHSPARGEPTCLISFTIEALSLIRGPRQTYLRWLIKDSNGTYYEGSNQPINLYKGWLIVEPTNPLIYQQDAELSAVVVVHLPRGYRLHHLSYLEKMFPLAMAA